MCFHFVSFLSDPTDSPIIRSRPANVEADIGSNVTLRCDFDGNPEPEISWTFENSRRVLSTGPAYTFWMTSDMAGKYTCTARVPGFPEVSADAHVLLKGSLPAWTSKAEDRALIDSFFSLPMCRTTDGNEQTNSVRSGRRYGPNRVRGFRRSATRKSSLDTHGIRSGFR